jgi:thioredoxin-like negative regulator of GroEL
MAAALTMGSLLSTGCNQNVRWEGPTYQDAQVLSQSRNQPTLIYFRSWYLVECTDFEEQVLRNPAVLAETRTMVCVVLDFDWDQSLARQWQLNVVPAIAILSPSGELLARHEAPLSREVFLDTVRSARANWAASAPPIDAEPAP